MVDFNKYSREAKKDPKFRDELLRGDANQVIKARFGDDLPYEVECEEEITFKIKESDSDFESVAGGVGGAPLEQGYSSGPNGIYGSAPSPKLVPVEKWESDMTNKGFGLETVIYPNDGDKSWYNYSFRDRSGVRCVEGVPLVRLGEQWYVKVND